MEQKLFSRLLESVEQMDEIARGERQPSREFTIDAMQVKAIRQTTGLSQAKFAAMIDVQLATLRNLEQGRRDPTGPAKALLRAIHNDPAHMIQALAI
jgi:putative transcriptional regulator